MLGDASDIRRAETENCLRVACTRVSEAPDDRRENRDALLGLGLAVRHFAPTPKYRQYQRSIDRTARRWSNAANVERRAAGRSVVVHSEVLGCLNRRYESSSVVHARRRHCTKRQRRQIWSICT